MYFSCSFSPLLSSPLSISNWKLHFHSFYPPPPSQHSLPTDVATHFQYQKNKRQKKNFFAAKCWKCVATIHIMGASVKISSSKWSGCRKKQERERKNYEHIGSKWVQIDHFGVSIKTIFFLLLFFLPTFQVSSPLFSLTLTVWCVLS